MHSEQLWGSCFRAVQARNFTNSKRAVMHKSFWIPLRFDSLFSFVKGYSNTRCLRDGWTDLRRCQRGWKNDGRKRIGGRHWWWPQGSWQSNTTVQDIQVKTLTESAKYMRTIDERRSKIETSTQKATDEAVGKLGEMFVRSKKKKTGTMAHLNLGHCEVPIQWRTSKKTDRSNETRRYDKMRKAESVQ